MNPAVDRDGYKRFISSVNRRRKWLAVHREVCRAFNGPPPFEGAEVRHLDGDNSNNRASNLAWGTSAENAQDRIRHGTTPRGSRNGRAVLTATDVTAIRAAAAAGESVLSLARRYGVAQSTMGSVVARKSWTEVA